MPKSQQPLYSVIKNELQIKIDKGDYLPDQQLPTENELSSLYSVSRITTRRALEELERDGYIYRVQGSGSFVKGSGPASIRRKNPPAEGEGKIISMILPHQDERAMFGYIRGASDYLNLHGYYLSIHTSESDPVQELQQLESVIDRGSSGVILYPLDDLSSFEMLNRLYLQDYPVVTIDKEIANMPIPSVVSDNFGGVYSSVCKLIDWGHRRIAFLTSVDIEAVSSVRSRYFGYCQAMKDRGIPISPKWVKLGAKKETRHTGSQVFFHQLLESYRAEGVTAVQVENDLIAVQLLLYATGMGIQVPKELSIFGFDNNPITEHLHVPLSTIDQNFDEIGRLAAEILLDRLEHGEVLAGKQVVPVRLIERSSVALLV